MTSWPEGVVATVAVGTDEADGGAGWTTGVI